MKAAPGVRQADHDRAVARLVAAAVEQGLGATITDPDVLDKAVVLFAERSERERKGRETAISS